MRWLKQEDDEDDLVVVQVEVERVGLGMSGRSFLPLKESDVCKPLLPSLQPIIHIVAVITNWFCFRYEMCLCLSKWRWGEVDQEERWRSNGVGLFV